MSLPEIVYRISQKQLAAKERRVFAEKRPVFDIDCYGRIPQADLACLGLNFANDDYSVGNEIELLGGYHYRDYRKKWHAAFQSEGDWSMRYAADYSFGADGVPGDIRTNWELNRHFQFSLLAKSFFVTNEKRYLDELVDLFEDWNANNPFMWGPEWASPMESSIRAINWLVAAAFLGASGVSETDGLRQKLLGGAYVMAANIRRHYSRYSSANNHTIVEAAGVAIVACVFGRDDWRDEALDLLEREVELQTWSDGVNKEQALHYQLFVMEALCLVSHALRASGDYLPASVIASLRSMAHYASVCRVGDSGCIEFGDDDEGVIFNPCGKKPFYLGYVLAFTSIEITEYLRWSDGCDSYEQLRWLYKQDLFDVAAGLPLSKPKRIETFEQGGVTFARLSDERMVLAFDHGPLGFGALAAHGHADALSIQLFVDEEPVLIDPGTYIYNDDREKRDLYRSTAMHNTVCVGGANQSEMLGSFLWGKKATVSDFELVEKCDGFSATATLVDRSLNKASRSIDASGGKLVITDDSGNSNARSTFLTPFPVVCETLRAVSVSMPSGNQILIESDCDLAVNEVQFSPSYGVTAPCWRIFADFCGTHETSIRLEAKR